MVFGKAKHDAPKVLNGLAQLGWETLPIALLGMPHYPASWVVDTWKPIGGCSFTGSPVALTGNSAFRFCLLMQWHTIATDPQHTPRGGGTLVDPDLEPFEPPQETNEELLVRQLLQAATDQNSQECGSQAADRSHLSLPNPQMCAPYLFVPWNTVAKQVGIPDVQAAPLPNLRDGVLHAVGLLPERRQKEFHAAFREAIASIPTLPEPVETLASLILSVQVKSIEKTRLWASVFRHMAEHQGFWLTTPIAPPPDCVQIQCGGLGGGTLGGPDVPTFHCRASLLYRRTQITLEAARLLPAHRRLPHVTFLNGLWWKLLALQPERILACLPLLQQSSRSTSAAELYCPAEFKLEGFSAGSYTGAVIFLALRRLFPACRLSAKLGAAAMPKGVFALLQTAATPGRCRVHLIHAEEDMLCDWQPNQVERHVVSHRLDYTVVGGSDKWMGTSKHQDLHWLRCQLPQGRHNLTDLKLSHPDVIPVRDRMAAPLRLASWVRFETVMDRREWSTAIAMLVPAIHPQMMHY